MARPRLIYFIHREGLTSVVRSQVVQPLLRMRDQFDCHLLFTLPVGHWMRPSLIRRNRELFGELAKSTGIPTSLVPVAPAFNRWWPEKPLLRRAFHRLGGTTAFVAQSRNCSAASLAIEAVANLRKAHVVYDVRGAEPEELTQRLGEEGNTASEWHPRNRSLIQQIHWKEEMAFQIRPDVYLCLLR